MPFWIAVWLSPPSGGIRTRGRACSVRARWVWCGLLKCFQSAHLFQSANFLQFGDNFLLGPRWREPVIGGWLAGGGGGGGAAGGVCWWRWYRFDWVKKNLHLFGVGRLEGAASAANNNMTTKEILTCLIFGLLLGALLLSWCI